MVYIYYQNQAELRFIYITKTKLSFQCSYILDSESAKKFKIVIFLQWHLNFSNVIIFSIYKFHINLCFAMSHVKSLLALMKQQPAFALPLETRKMECKNYILRDKLFSRDLTSCIRGFLTLCSNPDCHF